MNTLEFAQSALDTLRTVPDKKFNLELCGTSKPCGCAVHWMFKWNVLPTDNGQWDTGTGIYYLYNLQDGTANKKRLNIILGFDPDEACKLYHTSCLFTVSKAQVMQQLEEFIHAH